MKDILDFIKSFDLHTIIVVAIAFWWVNENLTHKIESAVSSLSIKIDRLDEKITDIDRRLCRLEGAFASRDLYVLKHEPKKEDVK